MGGDCWRHLPEELGGTRAAWVQTLQEEQQTAMRGCRGLLQLTQMSGGPVLGLGLRLVARVCLMVRVETVHTWLFPGARREVV